MAIFWLIFCILCSCSKLSNEYDIPKPKITVYEPTGIEITIPDEEGVQLISFHGNINKEIFAPEIGQIFKTVREKHGSFWTIREPRVALKNGDSIHFYIFVAKSGNVYRLDGTYVVKAGNTNTPKNNRLRRHQIQRRDVYVGDDNAAGSSDDDKKFKPRFGSDHCFHHSHFHPHNPGSDSDLGHFHAHPYPHPHPHLPESGYIPHTPFSSGPSFFHPEHKNHIHRHFKHPKYPHSGHDFNSNYPITSNTPEDNNARDSDEKFDQRVTTEGYDYDRKDTENKQFSTSGKPEVEISSSKLPDIDVRFKNEKSN